MGMSHTVTAVAPTGANAWTAVGTITVPAGAKRLMKVAFGYTPDVGTSAVAIHSAPVFRLIGSGLLEQSPHQYVGPGSDNVIIAAAGYIMPAPAVTQYDVDIPVSVGGTIDVQCNSLAEVCAGQVEAMLMFDENQATGKNSMSDYVFAAIPSAADVWTTVGTLTVPQAKEGAQPKKIKELVCEFVPDVAATAVSERAAMRFRMTGSGLAEGGSHEYVGQGIGGSSNTTGVGNADVCSVRYAVNIPVNAGGQILVETIHETELCDGGDSVFGVLYE